MTLEGCKLPRALENPIDDVLMVATEPLLGPLRDAGVTPNMITAASAAASFASVWCCFKGRPVTAAALWVLGYVFDIMDGFMARRYKLESRLGCLMDHATDLLAYAGLMAFVGWRICTMPNRILWPLWVEVVLAAGAWYHLQCQERGTAHMPIQGLDGCGCRDKAHLRWTRFLGTGTLAAWHVLLIVLFAHK